jgi:hypothetical protein
VKYFFEVQGIKKNVLNDNTGRIKKKLNLTSAVEKVVSRSGAPLFCRYKLIPPNIAIKYNARYQWERRVLWLR